MNRNRAQNHNSQELAIPQPQVVVVPSTNARPPEESTFDPTTPMGAKLYWRALMEPLESIKSKANLVIKVQHVFSHDAHSQDDMTGEPLVWRRTVVFDETGKGYDCGSMGVDKALAIIKKMIGDGPWNPPVECTVVVRELGGAKQWMVLMPDIDALIKRIGKPKRGA